jgi:hypothetical protein
MVVYTEYARTLLNAVAESNGALFIDYFLAFVLMMTRKKGRRKVASILL